MKRPSSSQTIGFCAPKVAKSSWIATTVSTTALWSTDSWLLHCFTVCACWGDTRGLVVVAVERVVSGEPSSSSSTTFRLLSATTHTHTVRLSIFGGAAAAFPAPFLCRSFAVCSVDILSLSLSLSLSLFLLDLVFFFSLFFPVSCRRRRGFRANDRP